MPGISLQNKFYSIYEYQNQLSKQFQAREKVRIQTISHYH